MELPLPNHVPYIISRILRSLTRKTNNSAPGLKNLKSYYQILKFSIKGFFFFLSFRCRSSLLNDEIVFKLTKLVLFTTQSCYSSTLSLTLLQNINLRRVLRPYHGPMHSVSNSITFYVTCTYSVLNKLFALSQVNYRKQYCHNFNLIPYIFKLVF